MQYTPTARFAAAYLAHHRATTLHGTALIDPAACAAFDTQALTAIAAL